jgi:hypothetical protein
MTRPASSSATRRSAQHPGQVKSITGQFLWKDDQDGNAVKARVAWDRPPLASVHEPWRQARRERLEAG